MEGITNLSGGTSKKIKNAKIEQYKAYSTDVDEMNFIEFADYPIGTTFALEEFDLNQFLIQKTTTSSLSSSYYTNTTLMDICRIEKNKYILAIADNFFSYYNIQHSYVYFKIITLNDNNELISEIESNAVLITGHDGRFYKNNNQCIFVSCYVNGDSGSSTYKMAGLEKIIIHITDNNISITGPIKHSLGSYTYITMYFGSGILTSDDIFFASGELSTEEVNSKFFTISFSATDTSGKSNYNMNYSDTTLPYFVIDIIDIYNNNSPKYLYISGTYVNNTVLEGLYTYDINGNFSFKEEIQESILPQKIFGCYAEIRYNTLYLYQYASNLNVFSIYGNWDLPNNETFFGADSAFIYDDLIILKTTIKTSTSNTVTYNLYKCHFSPSFYLEKISSKEYITSYDSSGDFYYAGEEVESSVVINGTRRSPSIISVLSLLKPKTAIAYEKRVKLSQSKIDGVTKKKVTSAEPNDVWVL